MKTLGRMLLILSCVGEAFYGLHFLDFEVKGILNDRGNLAHELNYQLGFIQMFFMAPLLY